MPQVQLVVVKGRTTTRWTEANLKPGDVVWVDEEAARHLLENGICKWPEAGPKNAVLAGPGETKAKDSAEPTDNGGSSDVIEAAEGAPAKKPSGEATAGRTIASPSSS